MRIGVITQGPDPAANSYAVAAARGLAFAVRRMNAAGGLLGAPLELVVEDDAGRPEASAAAARRLVDARVCFVVSLSNTLATLAAQEVTGEARMPHLAPCQSGRQLTTAFDNPWFWHTGPSSTLQVRTLVSYCRAREYRAIGVVADRSTLGTLLAHSFAEEMARCGIEVAGPELIGDADGATGAVKRLLAAKPDALVSAGVLVPQLLAMLRAWKDAGPAAPLLGSYNFSIGDIQAQAAALMDDVAYVDAFDPRKPQATAFSSLYARETGCAAGSLEGYGSDAVLLVADAVRRAGSTDTQAVRIAMQTTRGLMGVQGAVGATYEFREGGRVGFDPHGLVIRVHGRPAADCVVHTGSR